MSEQKWEGLDNNGNMLRDEPDRNQDVQDLRDENQRLREALVSADFALAVYEPDSKDTIRIARERIRAALTQPAPPSVRG